MSPRDWRKRIEDLLSCARTIRAFTQGIDLETFLEDPKTIRAVAWEFTVLGEAARAVPADVQARFRQIPWAQMQGIRNVLIHEYFRLDEEILWKASQEEIPALIPLLEGILSLEG